MIGFPDSATEILLMNDLGERIAVRLQFRRADVCFVEVSGGAYRSIEQLISALRGEFPGLSVTKGSQNWTEQGGGGQAATRAEST